MTNTLSDLTMNGDITVGTNNITMSGNLSSSGSPVTEGWFTDLSVANTITTSQIHGASSSGVGVQGTTNGGYAASGNIGEAYRVDTPLFTSSTVTLTIASPCVVTYTNHGLVTGQGVYFTTTGALPTGLSANTNYYVNVINANTFSLATTAANANAGTLITTTGTQSGAHTCKLGVIMTSNVIVDLMGITIPAGAWVFAATGWHLASGGAVLTEIQGCISGASGGSPGNNNGCYLQSGISLSANSTTAASMGVTTFSFTTPTLIYICMKSIFSSGSCVATGTLAPTRIA